MFCWRTEKVLGHCRICAIFAAEIFDLYDRLFE